MAGSAASIFIVGYRRERAIWKGALVFLPANLRALG
jgi:hypothetical protein